MNLVYVEIVNEKSNQQNIEMKNNLIAKLRLRIC